MKSKYALPEVFREPEISMNSYYYQIESQYRREKYQNLYSGTTRIVTVDMFLREIGLFLWWFLWG